MKKRILFVNDEMQMGGVSKVLNNLLPHFDSNQYDIDLLVLHYHGEMINDIPSNVKVIKGSSFFNVCDLSIGGLVKDKKFLLIIKKILFFLCIKTGLINPLIKIQRNKMDINGYDTEIAFKEGICTLFVACGDCKNKINWIHADYKVKNYASNYMNTMKNSLKKINQNIAVSNVVANSYREIFDLDEEIAVIHNVIDADEILNKSLEKIDFRDNDFSFISIGRIHPQKSYDRLCKASYQLVKAGYKFKVYVVGDGELKEDLIKQIEEYNLQNVVVLLGNQTNPYKYLRQCDCFVLSSLYEGIPTVVYESLILHVPVISTKVAGVEEQLNENTGIVFENSVDGIYSGMKKVLDSPELMRKFKDNLRDYRYNNDEILNKVKYFIDK